jgi:hypothetical protein
MQCLMCGSAGVRERQERTAQEYRRFRGHACGKQFNERALAHEHGEHRTFSEVSTVAHSLPVGSSQRRNTKPPARQLEQDNDRYRTQTATTLTLTDCLHATTLSPMPSG